MVQKIITKMLCVRWLTGVFSILAISLLSPPSLLGQESILDRVTREKIVRVGLCLHQPPLNYMDDNGRWTGFDRALAEEVIQRLGVPAEWVKLSGKTRFTFLASGRVDLSFCAISQTRGREKVIDYSVPYFQEGKRMMGAKAKGYKSLKDLIGKPIGVAQGSSAYPGLEGYFKEQGWPPPKLMAFQDNATAFAALKQGKVEGYSQDQAISVFVSNADPDFTFFGEYYQQTRYGIGVPHNQSKWRDHINFIMNDMYADGTYLAIYDKWFHPKTGKFPLPANVRENAKAIAGLPWP